MNRFPKFGVLLMIPALALLLLTGCPKKDEHNNKADDSSKNHPAAKKVALKGPQDANLKGIVKFSGDRPDLKTETAIEKFNNEKERNYCLSGGDVSPTNIHEQTWIIDKKTGGVANVVIWLEPGAGKKYADVKEETKDMFKKPAVLDQPFCQYIPHVVAVYGGVQTLEVKNTSKISHNVKISAGKNNEATNDPMSPGQAPLTHKIKAERSPLNIQCSIHSWMNAKLCAFDHPYFAVTKDDGSFEIHNIPSGEDLVLYVWHESMGSNFKKVAEKTFKLKTGPNTYNTGINAEGKLVK